jgi:hypothetical protein
MARPVSTVAVAWCGRNTTLSIAHGAFATSGSCEYVEPCPPPRDPSASAATSTASVDDAAARDVHQDAGEAERVEYRAIHEIVRRRAAACRDDQKIRFLGQGLEIRHEAVTRLRHRMKVAIGDRHRKPFGAARDRTAEPENSQPLTRSKNFSRSRSTTQPYPAAMCCCARATA